ncbi:hypothetical protein [Salinarimonas soli]|uniref:Uncharacterized protein n=1 Tax=Salinarimonas soli TaxID=1638099 RepID=A0A5B2VF38_9HYPH|nr:hypothetical protein [Salinarimonas soli]KAA2237226.1 hypothetical protein F0L46_09435 [Salinarimonas soli]
MAPEPGFDPIDPRGVPGAPDGTPDRPTGPRTPYPVNDPGIADPAGPGSEPDYLPPGGPIAPTPQM